MLISKCNVRNILLISLVLFSSSSMSQEKNLLTVDIHSFNKKTGLAYWLYEYDCIAWWTTDSLQAAPQDEKEKLGKEWFCWQQDSGWHATYGSYDNVTYKPVFHYFADSSYNIRRIYDTVDTSLCNSFARALINARKEMGPVLDTSGISFNKFVWKEKDSSLSVWIIPSFQPNSLAVYGGEFYYRFDHTGNHLVDKNEYFQGRFRAFKVGKPREIWLDYKDMEQPSLGAVFFCWYYRKYFTKIVIENKHFNTFLFKSEKGYTWFHVEKQE